MGRLRLSRQHGSQLAMTHNSQCPAAPVTNSPSADNRQLVEEEAPCARAVRPSVADGHRVCSGRCQGCFAGCQSVSVKSLVLPLDDAEGRTPVSCRVPVLKC